LTAEEESVAGIRLQGRADSLGYDAQVSQSSTGQLLVAISGVTAADSDTIVANLTAVTGGNVYLRPVLVDDRLDAPCVTGADSPGAPGALTDSIPAPIGPGESGYVAVRGGGVCKLGPAAGTGAVFAGDAEASLLSSGGWGVIVSLAPGPGGEGIWNTIATECFNATATCPTRQLAIEVDGMVISAPTVEQREFSGSVQITGSLAEPEARALAGELNSGAVDYGLVVVETQYITA
jgi:hypothetical protein